MTDVLVIVAQEDLQPLEGKHFSRIVSVQDLGRIADCQSRPGVFDVLLRCHHIMPNCFAAESNPRLLATFRGDFGIPLFLFLLKQFRSQHLARNGSVLVLAPLVLALHDSVGRQVRQPDG